MIAEGIYGSDVGRMPRPGDGPWSWLVSVSYAGRVLRWCSDGGQDVELDGVLYPANGDADFSGLAITDDLPIGSTGSPSRSVSVAVYMPDGLSVAQLERRGVRLAGSPVEVALLPDGGTISDRCVLLRGVVSEPTYGTADEPVLFTAREPEQQRDAAYPPEGARTVAALDFRSLDDTPTWFETSTLSRTDYEGVTVNIGQVWPRVFGKPGAIQIENGAASDRPATPAYVVAQHPTTISGDAWLLWEAILVSYEHVPTAGEYVQLTRRDEAYPNGVIKLSLPVYNGHDHRGVPFAYVLDTDVTAIADPYRPITGMDMTELLKLMDWHVSWGTYDNSAIGPAINGVTDPTAGDVLSWMVSNSALTWDLGRVAAASDALRGYRMAGAIEAATTPIDWLSDHVFGVLPCLLASGPLGLYPVAIPFSGDVPQPVAAITVDNADAVLPGGCVQIEADGDVDIVTVSWCRDGASGDFYKRAYRSGYSGQNRASGNSAWFSETLPSADKPPRSASYDMPYVWDDATAMLVLDWLAWRDMKQRRTVSIDVDASKYGHLAVGDVVTLTADDLHITGAPCLVASVRRSASPWWRVRVMPLDE